jgi:hypothetical protein
MAIRRPAFLLFSWFFWVSISLALSACNKPKVGGKCEVGQAICEGTTTVLACQGGTFMEAQCHGAGGCSKLGTRVTCDDSIADVGDVCLESETENRACSHDKTTSLLCQAGKFKAVQVCRGANACEIKGDFVTCDSSRAIKGDLCTAQGAFACAPDMKSRIVCNNGAFATDRACKGATGCHPLDYGCDETVSDVGDPCGISGMAACSSDGDTELICKSGAYFANRSCRRGCRVAGTKIECLQ